MKRLIENWAIKVLYLQCFQLLQRISRHKKRIIFSWSGISIFKEFATFKQALAVFILVKVCDYSIYEERLSFRFYTKQDHTLEEIQDIIRAYNTIPLSSCATRSRT